MRRLFWYWLLLVSAMALGLGACFADQGAGTNNGGDGLKRHFELYAPQPGERFAVNEPVEISGYTPAALKVRGNGDAFIGGQDEAGEFKFSKSFSIPGNQELKFFLDNVLQGSVLIVIVEQGAGEGEGEGTGEPPDGGIDTAEFRLDEPRDGAEFPVNELITFRGYTPGPMAASVDDAAIGWAPAAGDFEFQYAFPEAGDFETVFLADGDEVLRLTLHIKENVPPRPLEIASPEDGAEYPLAEPVIFSGYTPGFLEVFGDGQWRVGFAAGPGEYEFSYTFTKPGSVNLAYRVDGQDVATQTITLAGEELDAGEPDGGELDAGDDGGVPDGGPSDFRLDTPLDGDHFTLGETVHFIGYTPGKLDILADGWWRLGGTDTAGNFDVPYAFVNAGDRPLSFAVDGQVVLTITLVIEAGQGRVCLDPGHPSSPGDKLYEALINRKVAFFLRDLLSADGYEILLTVSDLTPEEIFDPAFDNEAAQDQARTTIVPLEDRTNACNNWNANYLLAIHHNGFDGVSNYTLALYGETSPGTPRFPEAVDWGQYAVDELFQKMTVTGKYNHGDRTFLGYGLWMLQHGTMVSLLTEGSFYDVPEERARLNDNEYLRGEAEALYAAFKTFVAAL